MRCTSIYFLCAANFNQRLSCVAQRAGGVNQVITQDAGLALYITDDVHNLGYVRTRTTLVDNRQTIIQLLAELAAAGYGAEIRRDNHDVVTAAAKLTGNIRNQDGSAHQVVHRNIKEALQLLCVQIHGQHAVCASGSDDVSDQLCRDRITSLGLSVLTCIAEIRDNGGNTACGRTLACINHNEQFHQIVIDRVAGRLDEEYIRTANRLRDGNRNLAVCEVTDGTLCQRQSQCRCNLHSQCGMRIARKNLNVFSVRYHDGLSSCILKNLPNARGVSVPASELNRTRYLLLYIFIVNLSVRACDGGGHSSLLCFPAVHGQLPSHRPARSW